MEIVKLCSKKYADLALNKGQIKLGVTTQYADDPHSEIGDEHEVVKDVGLKGLNNLTPEDYKRLNLPFSANTKIPDDGTMRIRILIPKVFLFSCTVNDEQIKQRAQKLEKDAGYIITDPDKFQTFVLDAIIKHIESYTKTFAPSTSPRKNWINYKPLDYDTVEKFDSEMKKLNDDYNVYFFKEPRYSYQKEYRFIWPLVRSPIEEGSLPTFTPIEPINDELILTIPEIIPILKRIVL